MGSKPEDPHRYRNTSDQDEDPHVCSNGTLLNLLGIQSTQLLEEIEAEVSEFSIAELAVSPIEGDFDLDHAKAVHARIFERIYPWAGETRRVDIMKSDTLFLPWRELGAFFERISDHLGQSGLAGPTISDERAFSREAGMFLGLLNRAHPFREGNGRTQRELLRLLARDHGYRLDWSGTSPMAMKHACIAFEESGKADELSKLIRLASSRIWPEQEPGIEVEP